MPKFEEAELRQLVAEGEIKGFTLDTNVIDSISKSGNLSHPNLRSIKELKSKGITFALSDVVIGEVTAHIRSKHKEAFRDLKKGVKEYLKVWRETKDTIDKLLSSLPDADGFDEIAKKIVDNFLHEQHGSVLATAIDFDMPSVLERYFGERPPFASGDKKHEFPDAIALTTINNWSLGEGFVLVVSEDKGWQDYCAESEYLYCCPSLVKAQALFYEDEELVSRFVKSFSEELDPEIISILTNAIQRDLDDLDFIVEAEAFMSWDYELEYAVVDEIGYLNIEGRGQEIVASNAEIVTFVIPVEAKINAQASFDFYVRDSIDGDEVGLGGNVTSTTVTHKYMVTVTISGKGDEEIEVIEAVVNPNTRLKYLDFGFVEPFSEPDQPWD